MIESYIIKNMGDYLSKINKIQEELTSVNGEVPHIWFRGQASIEQNDGSWKLIPKVQRFVSIDDKKNVSVK